MPTCRGTNLYNLLNTAQGKIKKLEHEALEATARTEAQRVEREDLENQLADAAVRAAP